MLPPLLWLNTRLRGHPWSISRGCKRRRTASSQYNWSRCLTRHGECGAFGTGWDWRWSRTPARWSCTASLIWTRTYRCWRWGVGRGEVAGPGLEEHDGAMMSVWWCSLLCCDQKDVQADPRPKLILRLQGGDPGSILISCEIFSIIRIDRVKLKDIYLIKVARAWNSWHIIRQLRNSCHNSLKNMH